MYIYIYTNIYMISYDNAPITIYLNSRFLMFKKPNNNDGFKFPLDHSFRINQQGLNAVQAQLRREKPPLELRRPRRCVPELIAMEKKTTGDHQTSEILGKSMGNPWKNPYGKVAISPKTIQDGAPHALWIQDDPCRSMPTEKVYG